VLVHRLHAPEASAGENCGLQPAFGCWPVQSRGLDDHSLFGRRDVPRLQTSQGNSYQSRQRALQDFTTPRAIWGRRLSTCKFGHVNSSWLCPATGLLRDF
jgi:hypothetical protein